MGEGIGAGAGNILRFASLASVLCLPFGGLAKAQPAQGVTHQHGSVTAADTPLQPLAQQVRQVTEGLVSVGQPLPKAVTDAINHAIANPNETEAVSQIEKALDPFVLAIVSMNPESRVKVEEGDAAPLLSQGGSRFFLVKVINQAGVTSPLRVSSPNNGPVYIPSTASPSPKMLLTDKDVRDRWASISLYQKPPMKKRLMGAPVEYQLLEVYSRDAGNRTAELAFDVGQGSADVGFRNSILVGFKATPAHSIRLRITDENGAPTTASLTIRDRLHRIYPSPSKRLAPDFYFQPQVYRADGETIDLPDGYYTVEVTGGPEYVSHVKEFAVSGDGPGELTFKLARWIDPSKQHWFSGDHHVHAAGCSHYENPTEGVLPKDMMRQIEGEKLNVGSVLTWGPSYYYQKQFFCAKDDPLSKPDKKMHYDLEISGFPSSFNGHLVLLGLKDQDYPNTKRLEDWPSWDLPILQWAKSQDAVVGFAHSGWGLEVGENKVPSYEMPAFDGIGANEYILDVTKPNTVDFISAGDTPPAWELSIWYHTLNVGFRTRISGETDFPCITDERVGSGRSYVKLDELSYAGWIQGLKDGRSYVSEGRTHLMDFSVNGTEVGTGTSEVALKGLQTVHAKVRVAARLDGQPHPELQQRNADAQPYWTIERARIGSTNRIPVELVVNGEVAARKEVIADGSVRDVTFDVPVERSSWIAVRTLPAAHTNPIFVLVDGKPIRASVASAEWCLTAVHQCWSQKHRQVALKEQDIVKAEYDKAEEVYRRLLSECQEANRATGKDQAGRR